MSEVRIPVGIPPRIKEGWLQLLAYTSDDASAPFDNLSVVLISHIPCDLPFTPPCELEATLGPNHAKHRAA
jgi:hypothetical protein